MFVNGRQMEEMTPRTLQDGDHIGIGEHELIFQAYKSSMSGLDIESMPTITVRSSSLADMTYRAREDELLTAATSDTFSTRSMNGVADYPASESPSPAAAPQQDRDEPAQP